MRARTTPWLLLASSIPLAAAQTAWPGPAVNFPPECPAGAAPGDCTLWTTALEARAGMEGLVQSAALKVQEQYFNIVSTEGTATCPYENMCPQSGSAPNLGSTGAVKHNSVPCAPAPPVSFARRACGCLSSPL